MQINYYVSGDLKARGNLISFLCGNVNLPNFLAIRSRINDSI